MKLTYGDLELNALHELGVNFTHYTPRRGRSKQINRPDQLPVRMWKDKEIVENPTMFFIIDNNGLQIAPTAKHEIEYPITAEVKFTDEAMAVAVTDELYAQGLEIEKTLPVEGTVILLGDGTYDLVSEAPAEEEVPVEETPVEEPVKEVRKAPTKERYLVSKKMIDDMFKLQYGDLIQVYDPETGEPIEQYIYVMGFNACPRLQNTRTMKDIDLYFLADHPYEVLKHAPR